MTVLQSCLCNARIKTTRTVDQPTIERLGNDEHLHSLDRSREAAPSALSIQLATVEASKGYAPAQVLNALRGVGTPNGATRMIKVGGQHMGRFTFYSILMVHTCLRNY